MFSLSSFSWFLLSLCGFEIIRNTIFSKQATFEPSFGSLLYNGYKAHAMEIGGSIYFWLPRSNERFYFKTGILYDRISYEGETYDMLKFPIQIQYMYTTRRLRPKASVGVNFQSLKLEAVDEPSHTFCLNAGFNYKIGKKTGLSAGINSDYTPIYLVIIDENVKFRLISYSFNVGFYFEL